MNSISINNARHQDALDQVANFKKAGGKIKKPPGNYEGQLWKSPEPKRRVTRSKVN